MQQMYDMIMKHKQAMQEMQMMWEKAIQQHQHGYDSDEEVDSELGTWEHQLRRMEMDKTRGAWGAAVQTSRSALAQRSLEADVEITVLVWVTCHWAVLRLPCLLGRDNNPLLL